MKGKIYKITNKVNRKFYVGRTVKSLAERFSNHCYDATKKNSTTYLHRAIRKYGKENFIIEEIEFCECDLGNREMFWISQLRPDYNQSLGGDGGNPGYYHTEETKKLLSEMRRGKYTGKDNPFYGRHHTEETKEKLRKMRKGKPSVCGFAGKSHTDESKAKTSQTLRNNPNIKRVKVFQYDIDGNFLREFESINAAARFVKTNASNIKYTCEGRFNHCKGYKWSYVKMSN
jgi:group I intron endonuclease